MKILVTGFKSFLGATSNPSETLALQLSHQFAEVESLILPVEFGRSSEILLAELQSKAFNYLLMLGQAGGRKNVCFEKVGLNWVQTIHADEAGVKPVTGFLKSSESLALMSTFPVDATVEKLKAANRDVEVSFSAGTFVCNELFYSVLKNSPALPSVFIHVPLAIDMAMEAQQEILISTIQHILKGEVI